MPRIIMEILFIIAFFCTLLRFMIWYISLFDDRRDIYVMPEMFLEQEFSLDEFVRFRDIMYDRRDNFIGDIQPRFIITPENGFIKIKPLNGCTNWIVNELRNLIEFGRLLVTTEEGIPTCIYNTTINAPNITSELFLTRLGPIAARWRVLNINQIMPHQFNVTFQVDVMAHRFIIMEQNRLRFDRTVIELNLERIQASTVRLNDGLNFAQPDNLTFIALIMLILAFLGFLV